MHIVVVTPVLDDWISAQEILRRLDAAFGAFPGTISVLMVDDGSAEAPAPEFGRGPYNRIQAVDLLGLKKNLGHQRALAVGLCHLADKIPCDAVLVMDGDGEDDPVDGVRLAERLAELTGEALARPIIFAERTRRSESLLFRAGYLAYRLLHYVLTGRGIRFGNFSIIPRERLGAVITEPRLWNHYAASVAGSRLPHTTIASRRAGRIAGRSRLNFVRLVVHGLSALSCYDEIIGVRLLLISSILFVLSVAGVIAIVILRFATDLSIPGWTSLFAGLLLIFLLQVITLTTNFTMQIISARSVQPFLPARDYAWYIDGMTRRFGPPV